MSPKAIGGDPVALSEIIKIDLHIHSAASAYKERPDIVSNSDIAHCELLIDKLIENDIRLFSITDHNRFDVELYRKLYKMLENLSDPKPNMLPGVEFDVSFDEDKKAGHVVVIFDAKEMSDLNSIADAIGADKLTRPEEAYNLDRFEALLRRIGLSMILIAHQHSGFGGGQKKRSLGAATDDAIELYKFGYIDALEYRSPTVQGILRSELNDLDLPAKTVIGSDCHDWSVYPKHDASAADPSVYCATVKALPTFRGIHMALTSPETRFGPVEQTMQPVFLSKISMCGEEIPLSPGINVIIGENGVGKSSILSLICSDKAAKNWTKGVQKAFDFSCETITPSNREYIEQGLLQNRYNSGQVFDDGLFCQVSRVEFSSRVAAFSESLKRRIKWNIRQKLHEEAAKTTSFSIKEDLEGETFHFTVSCSDDFTEVENPWTAPRANLRDISAKIDIEVKRESVYSSEDSSALIEAKRLIDSVEERIDTRYEGVRLEGSVKGVISNAVDSYSSSLELRSGDKDIKRKEYREAKGRLVQSVLSLVRDACDPEPPIADLVLTKEAGISENPSQGFKFVRKAKYAGCENLCSEFVAKFNKNYRSLEKMIHICSVEEIANAIPGNVQASQWETKFDELRNKFIEEMQVAEETIMDVDSRKTGNTLGEMALSFYQYKTAAQASAAVFVADQPEDNISNKRISAKLTGHFNSLRRRSQIILVTHNPLLVVNQDADNVIVMKRDPDECPSVAYGSLESEDHGKVLEEIANIMDGGKAAIRRRMKAYGTID